MAKISRDLLRSHEAACALLAQDRPLTNDEIHDVLDGWHEGAGHANSRHGAHFTPKGLARDFACEVTGRRVVDLCAGIGMLSYMSWQHSHSWAGSSRDGQENYTLVEINPDYAAVARRVLPGAEIIVGSIFDPVLLAELRSRDFDVAISNPPYGNFNSASGRGPRYAGSECHYAVIDVAAEIAREGVFLIPQNATPFRYSGCQSYREVSGDEARAYERFREQTGIEFAFNCGFDTSIYRREWRDVSVQVEIVLCDFTRAAEIRQKQAHRMQEENACKARTNQFSLFDLAA